MHGVTLGGGTSRSQGNPRGSEGHSRKETLARGSTSEEPRFLSSSFSLEQIIPVSKEKLLEGNLGYSEVDPLARVPFLDGPSLPRGFPCTADRGCRFVTVEQVVLLSTLVYVSGVKFLQNTSPTVQ